MPIRRIVWSLTTLATAALLAVPGMAPRAGAAEGESKEIQPPEAQSKTQFPLRLAFLPWLQLSGEPLAWLKDIPTALHGAVAAQQLPYILVAPDRVALSMEQRAASQDTPAASPSPPAPSPSPAASLSPSAPEPTPTPMPDTAEKLDEKRNLPGEDLTRNLINEDIRSLSDKLGVDVFVSGSIAQVGDKYWLLVRFIEGAAGKILLEEKRSLPNLTLESLSRQAAEILAAHPELQRNDQIIDLGQESDSGEIHFRSVPQGAILQWGDRIVGATPLILRHIPAGKYPLHLWETEPFSVSRVRVASEPAGIDVLLMGAKVGVTPMVLPLEKLGVGEFPITFDTKLAFDGTIEIITVPDGVPVQLDQEFVERTPIAFTGLKKEKYVLRILDNKRINIYKQVTVSPGIQVFDLDLYKLAKLVIESSEANADVYIDAERVGETPVSLSLSQGLHDLSVRKFRFIPQEQELDLAPGERRELFFEMVSSRSVDASLFLVPTGALSPKFNVSAKYLLGSRLLRQPKSDDPFFKLGQRVASSFDTSRKGDLAQTYGIEAYYGFDDLANLFDILTLGVSVGGFFHVFQSEGIFDTYQGVSAKLQLLRESQTIPLTASIGTYINIAGDKTKLVGYLGASRSLGDFNFGVGVQTHGFNLNIGYTGIRNLKLSGVVFLDSLFGFFSDSTHEMSPLYGVNVGYTF